jgi:hypothetical protein
MQINKKSFTRLMASSGMLRSVVLVRTDVSEELSASIIPEDAILHSYRRENFKLYKPLTRTPSIKYETFRNRNHSFIDIL